MGYNERDDCLIEELIKEVINLKFLVLFHTVTGNNYLIGKQFTEAVQENGHEVVLRRIEDNTMDELRNTYEIINEYYEEILNVKSVTKEDLIDKDVIVLGSPTYYGNFSGKMKTFFDSLVDFWANNILYKKKLMTFTTMGDINGGGEMCLKSLITLGQHMGMQFVPVSPAMTQKGISSYGIKLFVGEFGDKRPTQELKNAIKAWIGAL
ncbi:MAG: flavodoxin family protein [Thermotogota bacterium]